MQAGDKVGGITAVHRSENVRSTSGTSLADPIYRQTFLKRVTVLPPASVAHVPIPLRQWHALVMASLLESIAEGSAEACALEQSRTKLLLGPMPRNTNTRCELARRLERWKNRNYEELLCRAEDQCRVR